jgi:hypothetical protein
MVYNGLELLHLVLALVPVVTVSLSLILAAIARGRDCAGGGGARVLLE